MNIKFTVATAGVGFVQKILPYFQKVFFQIQRKFDNLPAKAFVLRRFFVGSEEIFKRADTVT